MLASASVFAISTTRLLIKDELQEGIVLISDGKIVEILNNKSQLPENCQLINVNNLVVMPGLVDSHVHINEPGRTEWEGFQTATSAAAAGGITTVADMPLNSNPVTTSLPALQEKLAAAKGKLFVDCAFYGGVIPGNASALEPLIDAGVTGFKCFLIHSGIDDFPNVTQADLLESMPILARRNVPLLVHAELETCCGAPWDNPQSYQGFLHSRPRRWENDAIDLMIKLCRQTNCRVHIVHLSSSDALPSLTKAKKEGLPITVETCPHYLSFQAETIPDADTRYKCAPPIREDENCKKLWQALEQGTINFIVSDHSPCTPALKFLAEGDLQKAWGGISSLQFGLPAIWTEAKKKGATITDLARWMCWEPAKFLQIDKFKGRLAPGYDADIVIWDPEAEFQVQKSIIQHRHKVTPYENRTLYGVVKHTFVRGKEVYDGAKVLETATGKQILHMPIVESKK